MKRFCLLLGLFAMGCQSPDNPPAAQQPAATASTVQEYNLDGEIVSVDKDKKTAVVKHQEIQGFMAAMTMAYPIPEQADLDKIKPGDQIKATVFNAPAESRMWLGNIQVAE